MQIDSLLMMKKAIMINVDSKGCLTLDETSTNLLITWFDLCIQEQKLINDLEALGDENED